MSSEMGEVFEGYIVTTELVDYMECELHWCLTATPRDGGPSVLVEGRSFLPGVPVEVCWVIRVAPGWGEQIPTPRVNSISISLFLT